MKIGNIVTTNEKGQLVIPASIRTKLGITDQVPLQLLIKGNALYIVPIKDVITLQDSESSLVHILKKTQGSWGKVDKEEQKKEQQQKELELKAVKDTKNSW